MKGRVLGGFGPFRENLWAYIRGERGMLEGRTYEDPEPSNMRYWEEQLSKLHSSMRIQVGRNGWNVFNVYRNVVRECEERYGGKFKADLRIPDGMLGVNVRNFEEVAGVFRNTRNKAHQILAVGFMLEEVIRKMLGVDGLVEDERLPGFIEQYEKGDDAFCETFGMFYRD